MNLLKITFSMAIRKSLLATLGLLTLSACTQTIIVYKPSAKIDPMPNLERPQVMEAKADPLLQDQWYLQKIGVTPELLKSQLLSGNYNVRIAILSTGVDYNHEDLQGQIFINEKEITQDEAGKNPGVNRIDDDGNGLVDDVVGYDVIDGDGLAFDRHGAGTAVAGIIAANIGNGVGISGLMRNVSLYPIRYIDDNGQTSVAALASALDVAIKSKSSVVFIQNIDIRLGGHEGSPEVKQAELMLLRPYFKRLSDLSTPVVIGAGEGMTQFGSDGNDLAKLLKSFDNVIVVAATKPNDQKTMLSNFGLQEVSAAAPGEKLLSLKPFNKYGEVSGTAFAAAQVTAAVGLARALMGERADSTKIRQALASQKSGDAVADLMTRSASRLNVVKFLNEIRSL